MNNVEQYLFENPEEVEKFLKENHDLLNKIKQRYADMLETGDFVGRFLLSKALMEIVKVTTEAGQELLKAEIQAHGLTIMDRKGNC